MIVAPITFWIHTENSDDLELLKEMVKIGKDDIITIENKNIILWLIEVGWSDAASQLIEAGAYISEYDIGYMIKLAKRKGYNDVVEKLVKRKEEIETEKLKDD